MRLAGFGLSSGAAVLAHYLIFDAFVSMNSSGPHIFIGGYHFMRFRTVDLPPEITTDNPSARRSV